MVGSNELLRSPKQAANVFSQIGGLPRQKHVFLVRFVPNGSTKLSDVTFAAKSVDRPRINITTEQLNEYNKKRQVITGLKLEPIRAQFYDSKDGAAQNMWMQYANHYFGDFKFGNEGSYAYDATYQQYLNVTGSGFGFTASNGGASVTDTNAQFFFKKIEIYHFYDRLYDLYVLINPRIVSWEPDDLDYENSSIAVINSQFAYEGLQYITQQTVDANNFPEFTTGKFWGDPIQYKDSSYPQRASELPPSDYTSPSNPFSPFTPNQSQVFGNLTDYRYSGEPSSGALGTYGNFVYGPAGNGSSLSSIAQNNSQVAAALSLNATGDPLGINTSVYLNAQTGVNRGLNSAQFDAVIGQIEISAGSPYASEMASTMASGMLASDAMGQGDTKTANGLAFTPQAYGAINARQTGTAQYGFNAQTTPNGQSYGYTGPNGFNGPVGIENNGPYKANQPAGLDGRYINL